MNKGNSRHIVPGPPHFSARGEGRRCGDGGRSGLWVLVCALVLSASACGYTLVGKGRTLDPSIRTIEIPAFVNKTTRVELEQRVTQAVADEFVSRGRLRLVKKTAEADVILRGSIDSVGIVPVAFNQEGRATQYQLSITANIELLDHRSDDKVLWKNDQYRFTENYQVDVTSSDSFDQESRAIREIAVRFAESLVTNLLEGF